MALPYFEKNRQTIANNITIKCVVLRLMTMFAIPLNTAFAEYNAKLKN